MNISQIFLYNFTCLIDLSYDFPTRKCSILLKNFSIPTLQGMASCPRNPCKIFVGQIKRSLAREVVVVAVLMELGMPYPDKAIFMVTYVCF